MASATYSNHLQLPPLTSPSTSVASSSESANAASSSSTANMHSPGTPSYGHRSYNTPAQATPRPDIINMTRARSTSSPSIMDVPMSPSIAAAGNVAWDRLDCVDSPNRVRPESVGPMYSQDWEAKAELFQRSASAAAYGGGIGMSREERERRAREKREKRRVQDIGASSVMPELEADDASTVHTTVIRTPSTSLVSQIAQQMPLRPWTLGEFANLISSPIVTLIVGQSDLDPEVPQMANMSDIVTFSVHEHILIRVPFFAAALRGQFREAREKVIHLPEDDPEVLSKLIEYLYTGGYSEPMTVGTAHVPLVASHPGPPIGQTQGYYNQRKADHYPPQANYTFVRCDTPTPNRALDTLSDSHSDYIHLQSACEELLLPLTPLPRKLFHAHVYVLGEKYDCPGLRELAARNIRACPLYKNHDRLDYWVSVYEMTGPGSALRMRSSTRAEGEFYALEPDMTRRWVAELWKDEGERGPTGLGGGQRGGGKLGEACERCPDLARDLLAVVCEVDT
ncbi:hypothetical protein BDZ91DRAFT_791186 [Kalaharituber pfeilii]|nr:hypothetical protein BDZ91DRAFT_791186 [Kalaharituber pfeilii]